MEEGKILVGQVVGLHGRFGEIKVKVLTDFPGRFSPGNSLEVTWNTLLEGKAAISVSIEKVRPHKKNLLIRLKGVETREMAERFLGGLFQIDKKELMPLPDGSYYHFQIEGLEVFSIDDEYIGRVSEILMTPNHDIYVVNGEREYLVPALKRVIKRVDLANEKIWIDREMISYFED